MNRRELLTLIGAGTISSIAGCASEGNPDEIQREESQAWTDLPEEEQQEVLTEHLEEAYERRVEDGKLIRGHNLDIAGVFNISDSSVELETTLSLNPIDDYTINLHYNPVTADEHGEWVYQNYLDPMYGGSPDYDEESEQWEPADGGTSKKLLYEFDDASVGKKVSSLNITSETYWGEDATLGEQRVVRGGFFPEYIEDHGWSYLTEFELENPPEMYQTFVYTLTWEDEHTESSRAGEVIANSPPMVRVGEDEYIYPRTHNGNGVIQPNWDGIGDYIQDDNRDYGISDVYRQDTNSNNGTREVNVTRLSNYGRFSPRIRGEFADVPSVKLSSAQGPEYLDANLQYPWTVSYEIPTDTLFEARNEGSRIYSSGANQLGTTSSSQVGGVNALINSDEVMNHEVVKDVASKLGDICEMMNANHPVEQVRVVADFVQYFSHTSDGAEFGRPSYIRSGTGHPVETLATGIGDCKDFTVLGNAILQQEPFNMNPDAIVIPEIYQYVAEGTGNVGTIGHVTTAVPTSDLRLDEMDLSNAGRPLRGVEGRVNMNGQEYVYIEMSGPFDIGFVYNQWMESSSLEPISNFV